MTSGFETKYEDGKVYARWSPDQPWVPAMEPEDEGMTIETKICDDGFLWAKPAPDGDWIKIAPSSAGASPDICTKSAPNPSMSIDSTMATVGSVTGFSAGSCIGVDATATRSDHENYDAMPHLAEYLRSEFPDRFSRGRAIHCEAVMALINELRNPPSAKPEFSGHGDSSDVVINDPNGDFMRKR